MGMDDQSCRAVTANMVEDPGIFLFDGDGKVFQYGHSFPHLILVHTFNLPGILFSMANTLDGYAYRINTQLASKNIMEN